MEKPGYEWSGKEQHDIAQCTDGDVKPKHGIVVVGRRALDVCKPLGKAAALQVACYKRENGKHAHYAIVIG